MGYINGEDRDQVSYALSCLDDFINENNPVRVIDAFVDSLDMEELKFSKIKLAVTGRPPYAPKHLLKLYIYGYMNRIRSSRRLETEAIRNLELMWLMNKLTPDFKTISDFRKDNKEAISSIFKKFVLLCKGWDLFGKELVAIDGTKIRAQNSKKKNFNNDKLDKRIKEIDEKINEYLKSMDENDKNEEINSEITNCDIAKKVEELKQRKQKYETYKEILKESGETQVSETDPDSRSMPDNQKINVGYNVQTAVDDKHKLITNFEVTNEVKDINLLSSMAKKSKETLEVESLEVLADKGYYKATEIKECIDNNINVYIPKPENSNKSPEGGFQSREFIYNAQNDTYTCPGGFILEHKSSSIKDGKLMKRYHNHSACKNCPVKNKCTKSKESKRSIDRWEHEEILIKVQQQTKENFNKYRKRQQLSEHPFGTIKRGFDSSYVLTKGLDSVRAELSLTFFTYNLKRVINILGVKEILNNLAWV
jgi:transposase